MARLFTPKSKKDIVRNLKGYAFIAPNYILMLIFAGFPILCSFILSFTKWDLMSGLSNLEFVGVQNFIEMFQDEWFLSSLLNNFYFTMTVVPLTMMVALVLAIVMNQLVIGAKAFRLFFFMPHITNIAAISILWTLLYSKYGPIANTLRVIGIEDVPNFLADPKWAMPAVIAMTVWKGLGYCMLIYIAGLQGIPKDLYEAISIDGGNWWHKFTKITIPMLSPTTFFIMITQVINSFKVFGQIQMMTEGGPLRSTTVVVYYIYKSAFEYYKFGYASSMAMVLFALIFIVTIIQWRGQKKWVNY